MRMRPQVQGRRRAALSKKNGPLLPTCVPSAKGGPLRVRDEQALNAPLSRCALASPGNNC